jgi:hypothetical protein
LEQVDEPIKTRAPDAPKLLPNNVITVEPARGQSKIERFPKDPCPAHPLISSIIGMLYEIIFGMEVSVTAVTDTSLSEDRRERKRHEQKETNEEKQWKERNKAYLDEPASEGSTQVS